MNLAKICNLPHVTHVTTKVFSDIDLERSFSRIDLDKDPGHDYCLDMVISEILRCGPELHKALKSNIVAWYLTTSPSNGRRWKDDGVECLRYGNCPSCGTTMAFVTYPEDGVAPEVVECPNS